VYAHAPGSGQLGRAPISFFAPDNSYAIGQEPGAAARELKQVIKGFHEAGLEVILQARSRSLCSTFRQNGCPLLALHRHPHSTLLQGALHAWENDPGRGGSVHLSSPACTAHCSNRKPVCDSLTSVTQAGTHALQVEYCFTGEGSDAFPAPTSLRGLDAGIYYRTGSLLNGGHAAVRTLIVDSLKHWACEYDVDGFCFVNAENMVQGKLATSPSMDHLDRRPHMLTCRMAKLNTSRNFILSVERKYSQAP
jgi:hypothetical protein